MKKRRSSALGSLARLKSQTPRKADPDSVNYHKTASSTGVSTLCRQGPGRVQHMVRTQYVSVELRTQYVSVDQMNEVSLLSP